MPRLLWNIGTAGRDPWSAPMQTAWYKRGYRTPVFGFDKVAGFGVLSIYVSRLEPRAPDSLHSRHGLAMVSHWLNVPDHFRKTSSDLKDILRCEASSDPPASDSVLSARFCAFYLGSPERVFFLGYPCLTIRLSILSICLSICLPTTSTTCHVQPGSGDF